MRLTPSEYVLVLILIGFPQQQRLHESTSILRLYVSCRSCSLFSLLKFNIHSSALAMQCDVQQKHTHARTHTQTSNMSIRHAVIGDHRKTVISCSIPNMCIRWVLINEHDANCACWSEISTRDVQKSTYTNNSDNLQVFTPIKLQNRQLLLHLYVAGTSKQSLGGVKRKRWKGMFISFWNNSLCCVYDSAKMPLLTYWQFQSNV